MLQRVANDLGISISEAEELISNKEIAFDKETGMYYRVVQRSTVRKHRRNKSGQQQKKRYGHYKLKINKARIMNKIKCFLKKVFILFIGWFVTCCMFAMFSALFTVGVTTTHIFVALFAAVMYAFLLLLGYLIWTEQEDK